MATYYWVGGTGTWNGTSATNWSLTSGGSGGAGVPTSTDDVVIDANSGSAFFLTLSDGVTQARCQNFLCTNTASVRFGNASGNGALYVYGSFQLLAGFFSTIFDAYLAITVKQSTGTVFNSVRDIKSLRFFNGIGTSCSVALNSNITTGDFNTEVSIIPSAIYSINCSTFQLGPGGVAPRILGSASYALTINLAPVSTVSSQYVYYDNWANINDNIINSSLNFTPNSNVNELYSSGISNSNKRLDVTIVGGTTDITISGALVNNLTLTNSAVTIKTDLYVYGNVSLTGTASCTSTYGTRLFLSKTSGSANVARTVVVASTAQWVDLGFYNNIAAGTDTVSISGSFGTSTNPIDQLYAPRVSIGLGTIYVNTLQFGSGTSLSGNVFHVNYGFSISPAGATVSGTYTINAYGASVSANGVAVPNLNFIGVGYPATVSSNLNVNNLSITATTASGGIQVRYGSTITVTGTFTLAGVSSTNNVVLKAYDMYGETPVPYSLIKTSGTVNAAYASIGYCNASGGAVFQAFETNGCVDLGNNTGWIFKPALGNFFMFM